MPIDDPAPPPSPGPLGAVGSRNDLIGDIHDGRTKYKNRNADRRQ
jgi:hypothetical protein